MKASIALLLSGLAAQQVVATWDRNAPHYNTPDYNNNECSDKQKGGYDWSDLKDGDKPGKYDNDIDFSGGWTCSSSFGKRDHLTKRTFKPKCIKDKVSKEKPASVNCGKKDGFSVTEFQISVQYDTDIDFHYKMPDGSTCKQTSHCKKEGTTVYNTQCGGAKSVDVYLGKNKGNEGKDKNDCEIGFHHIGFDCNPGKPYTPPPAYTPPPKPSCGSGYGQKPCETSTPPPKPTCGNGYGQKPCETSTPPPKPTCGNGYGEKPCESSTTSSTTSAPDTTTTSTSETTSTTSTTPAPDTTTCGYGYNGTVCTSSTTSSTTESSTTEATTTTTSSSEVPTTTTTSSSEVPTTTTTSSSEVPTTTTTSSSEVPTTTTTSSSEVPTTTTSYSEGPTTSSTSETTSTTATSPTDSTTYSEGPSSSTTTTSYSEGPSSSSTTTSPSSTPTYPVGGYTPPGTLPGCINTWLPLKTDCKDNTDSECYCKVPAFTDMVLYCVAAHGSEQESQEAVQYFIGICANDIPSNPGLITNCPTYIPINPTTSSTTAETTVTVPGTTTTAPVANPPSYPVTTVSVGTSYYTVPQVVFTTETPGAPGVNPTEPIALVPATTPAPVQATTTAAPYPSGLTSVTVPGTTGLTPSNPAEFTGAAAPALNNVKVPGAIAGAILAFLAL